MNGAENNRFLFSSFMSEFEICKKYDLKRLTDEVVILRAELAEIMEILTEKRRIAEAEGESSAYPRYWWLPASEACDVAEKIGLIIDLQWICKHKSLFHHRKPKLEGNHKLEVEYHDLVRAFVNEQKLARRADDEEICNTSIAVAKKEKATA